MKTSAPAITPTATPLKAAHVYLNFRLSEQTPALIAALHSQEVREISATQITAMPHMPDGVLGLFNNRNHIFWIVDLAQTLGLEPLASTTDSYSVMVLRIPRRDSEPSTFAAPQEVLMGFAVHQVKGSLRLPDSSIRPPAEQWSSPLAPYLTGTALHQEDLFWILDPGAIAHACLPPT